MALQIRILASVESPYIIKFNEAFVHNMNLYIITEYAGNGDMFQRLRRLAQKRQMMPEDKAWVFFIQLAVGIQALHKNNILHRCVSETHQPAARPFETRKSFSTARARAGNAYASPLASRSPAQPHRLSAPALSANPLWLCSLTVT